MLKNRLKKLVGLLTQKWSVALILLLLFVTPTAYAQGGDLSAPAGLEPALRFAHLTTEDGLAHNRVETIFQDSQGFMWFGTQEGLSRYDGYHFTTYQYDPDNPNSLQGNIINDIIEDDQGQLWISGGGGVTLFDPRQERFTPLPLDRSRPVRALVRAGNGLVWLGTAGGELIRLDPATRQTTLYPLSDNAANSPPYRIWEMIEDRSGNLWLAASSAVLKFDPQTEQVTPYTPPDPPGEIRALYEDEAGHIWFDGLTLHKLDPASEAIATYASPLGPVPIVHAMVDSNQQMWLATLVGLFRFDLQTEQFTAHFTHSPSDPDSLSSDRTFFLFEDRSGLIWIGTDGAGLNLLNPRQSQFAYYRHDPDNPNSLAAARVTSLVGDESGLLWLGADTTLDRFNPATGQIDHYELTSAGPGPIGISALYWDTAGQVWFGLTNQLFRFIIETAQFTAYDLPGQMGGPPNPITAIYRDETGLMWVGQERGGFFTFDPTSETFQPGGIGLDNIKTIYPDPDGGLWLAYSGELSHFDPKTQQLDTYKSSHGQVNALYRDPAGYVWVGAVDGLYRFEPATASFTRYTGRDGLPSSRILAILEDQAGYLWLSTSRGLSRFNLQTGAFRNYDLWDGLQGNEFMAGAAWQAPDGRMYFGGQQGLTAFYPDQISDNANQPPVVLTDIHLFNRPLTIGEESPLSQAINFTDRLTFTHNQNIISFEFAALNYAAPHKNRYRYRLEGFEDDWIEVGSDRRFVTYTSLPAGNYVFRVQGTNDSGLWSEQEVALNITITPPWWETAWFRILSIAALAGLVYSGYRWRVKSIKAHNRQLEAEVSARTQELAAAKESAEEARYTAEAANRAKSAFLANMSHELRSPLNAILGFAQVMARNNDLAPDDRENVSIISRSGEHLLSLINQVLDLSKIEAGRTTLNETNFDFYRLLDDISNMFTLKAEEKGLRLLIEQAGDVPRYIRTDELKLRQVLINLLGNALKFTGEGGVTLRIGVKSNESHPLSPTPHSPSPIPHSLLHFEIEDTGSGIAPEEIDHLFEAFTQTASGRYAQEGTGLGLPISRKFVQLIGGEIGVKSVVGRGTLFNFDIQVEAVEADQIIAHKAQAESRIIALAPDQPHYRLLIVDDDPINRQLLVKLLNPLDFALKEAENGQEAVSIWREWQPHLIWMDMRMPVMDGYEAARQIKATTQGQATAIIALTASSFEEERSIVLSAGCDDFLRKPFREADIFETMRKHIGVQYIYQAPVEVEPQPAREADPKALTSEIAALSPALVARLKQAVELSYVDQIDQVIAEIQSQHPALADKLAQMAHNFEYDKILDL